MPMFKRHALGAMSVCSLVTFALASGTALAQTPGTIAQFVTPSAFGDSPIFNWNGRIGIGTTTPQDFFAVNFSDNSGVFTGMAVKNTNSGPSAYSGMLFYDHNGLLGVFQGFNNSTKEYRINNVAAGGSIHFLQGQQSRFYVNNVGNIGIGTTSPTKALEVGSLGLDGGIVTSGTGSDLGVFLRNNGAGGNNWFIDSTNNNSGWGGGKLTFGLFATSPFVTITNTGSVGIGTTNPTRAKLEISGAAGHTVITGGFGALGPAGAGSPVCPGGGCDVTTVSAYASDQIVAVQFLAFSDERTKRSEGRSDAVHDLATLAGIEVTDYTHIDTVTKGTGKHKKVIAQQVEKVYPQAVSRITDVVPDIYKKAPIKDGWVSLATNLKKGERVRLIGNKAEGIHEVLEIAEGRFRTAFAGDGDAVFVFGREVKDFRLVDYEAIAMLNVSATQELHRQIQTQAAEMGKQSTELSMQRVTIGQQAAELEQQSSEIAKLKQQMAQLLAAAQGTRPTPAHFAPSAR